jgi:Fe-S cluster biogenesis protein NfuA
MEFKHNHKTADENVRIEALVEKISAYIEQYHGGFVEFVSYEDKVLKVKMGGACSECNMTETTLQGWIAGTVRQFFPDVQEIVEA